MSTLKVLLVVVWVWIIYVAIKHSIKIKTFNYTPSEYYNEDSFPMGIIYKTNGFTIKNATKSIREVISHYNTTLDHEMFHFGIINKNNNKQSLIVTIQNTLYSHGCPSSFDGFSGVLAHATLPPNRLLCIDVSENWDYRNDAALFKRVLVHELGHILGLEHAFNKNSVMSYDDIQQLQNYDVDCLKKIYPFLNKNQSPIY